MGLKFVRIHLSLVENIKRFSGLYPIIDMANLNKKRNDVELKRDWLTLELRHVSIYGTGLKLQERYYNGNKGQ